MLMEDERVNVNIVDNWGLTPLATACYNGRIEVVKALLMDSRIDVFVETRKGNNLGGIKGSTALDIAIQKGFHEIANLIESEINKRNQGNK